MVWFGEVGFTLGLDWVGLGLGLDSNLVSMWIRFGCVLVLVLVLVLVWCCFGSVWFNAVPIASLRIGSSLVWLGEPF